MADKNDRFVENKPGKFYVDRSCIACDACVIAAPDHFSMHEDDGHAFVQHQPNSEDEVAACKEAMEGCPVEAIGEDGA